MAEKEKSKMLINDKELVIPGEAIARGLDYLPGSGTYRDNEKVVSKLLGVLRMKNSVLTVVPLSGVYIPRANDKIIGQIEEVESTSWRVSINSSYQGFLNLSNASEDYVDIRKTDISQFYDTGDLIYCKVLDVKKTGSAQLTMLDRGCKKLDGGKIVEISPSKVPRLIGKKGSMIEKIKEGSGCQIIVGQNGLIWVKGEKEILATKAIKTIDMKSHKQGLTDEIEKMFKKEGEK